MTAKAATVGEAPSEPTARIEAIRGSVRCLVLGVLSLVPVVGILFGILSVGEGWRVQRARRGLWNPGRHLVAAGLTLAFLGLLLATLAGLGLLIGIYMSATGEGAGAG